MLKKTITYTDYDGNERTEDFYFNLNKAELTTLEFSEAGGLINYLERIIAAQDGKSLISVFEDIILLSYGVKSPDGKQFIKNDEIRDAFKQTEAYSDLFMELATDDLKAIEFINGIMPVDIKMQESEVKKMLNSSDNPANVIKEMKNE